MSDLIVSGKDSVTGQRRIAGPDDSLIDSSGSPVAGVFEPLEGATGSVINGNGHTTQHGTSGYTPNYSFIQGYGNTSYIDHSFVQGKNNVADLAYDWPSPAGYYPNYHATFIQGRDNSSNGNYGTFMQGYQNTIHRNTWGAFVQGSYNNVYGWASLVQGFNNYNATPNFGSSIVQGRDNTNYGYGCIIQGVQNTIGNNYFNFVQGKLNVINDNAPCSFVQGSNNYINEVPYNFVQGKNCEVRGNHVGTGDGGNLVQGYNCSTGPYGGFCQGLNNYQLGFNGFTQGINNDNSSNYVACAMGGGITIYRGAAQFAQGYGITIVGNQTASIMSQGYGHVIGVGTSGAVKNALVQGHYNYVYAVGGTLSNALVQGQNNYVYNDNCFAQGYKNIIKNSPYGGFSSFKGCFAQGSQNEIDGILGFAQGSQNHISRYGSYGGPCFVQGYKNDVYGIGLFAQGRFNDIDGDYSFAQGRLCTISADRCFVQGNACEATRDDQKTWGSNRTGSAAAQKSRMIKWRSTGSNIQVTMATLDLETDKAYSIKVNLVARNTAVGFGAENASFILAQALAYRDVAGGAILPGGPIALTRADSGGGSIAWLADIAASGNDILLRITGDAIDQVEWCADFEFVEIEG